MRCPNCGGFVKDGAIFCTACGAQMAPGPQGQWGPPPPPTSAQPRSAQVPYPYQPPPYQYTAPPKKDDGATILKVVVIVVVIVVVLAVAVGAIFWMIVRDVVPDDGPSGTTLNLAAPHAMRRDTSNLTVWDVSIEINRVTSDMGVLSWPFVRVSIMDDSRTSLVADMMPLPDDPEDYDDGSDGEVEVEVWYVDDTVDGFIQEGDGIKITGMDRDYEGGTVVIRYTGEQIGLTVLPSGFP